MVVYAVLWHCILVVMEEEVGLEVFINSVQRLASYS